MALGADQTKPTTWCLLNTTISYILEKTSAVLIASHVGCVSVQTLWAAEALLEPSPAVLIASHVSYMSVQTLWAAEALPEP
jgi:hypothetical protein